MLKCMGSVTARGSTAVFDGDSVRLCDGERQGKYGEEEVATLQTRYAASHHCYQTNIYG